MRRYGEGKVGEDGKMPDRRGPLSVFLDAFVAWAADFGVLFKYTAMILAACLAAAYVYLRYLSKS